MISIACPACQKSYRLDDEFSGKKVRCKSCDEVFRAEPSTGEFDANSSVIEPKSPQAQNPTAKPPANPAVAVENPFADDNLFRSDGESLEELPSLPKPKPRAVVKKNDVKETTPKRRRTSRSDSAFERYVAAIAAGMLGGTIGVVIWSIIVYFIHKEVGYVALGIGGLVGFCVRLAAGEARFATGEIDHRLMGVIAATLSIISIVVGKFIAAVLIVNWLSHLPRGPRIVGIDRFWSIVLTTFKGDFGLRGSFVAFNIAFFLVAVATAYYLGSRNKEA